MLKKGGGEKTKQPAQTGDQKRSRTSQEKRQIKQKLRRCSARLTARKHEQNKTVRLEKGRKTTTLTSSPADMADITQLSNILQSSLSSTFAGLTVSLKTGFDDLGKLIQDSKRPEAQESGSESGDSGDEDSDKNGSNGSNEPPAKRQKAGDSSPATIEKLTKDLALEDEKGPDINVQLAGLVHKLLREAKPN